MLSTLTPVAATLPVAPYIGGKRSLAKTITALIEATPHDRYSEAFVGMGGIFLRRRARPKVEVINDLSDDVWTLFRVVQEHLAPFLDVLRKLTFTSRTEFDRLVRIDPSTLTDLQRAARFLYLQRVAFGGKVAGRHFAMDGTRPARFSVRRLEPMLISIQDRLAEVMIERLPWSEFIRRYDGPGGLIYLDPPYHGCEGDYGPGMFDRGQFALMAEQLAGLQGRFILSINDTPEIRETFAAFEQIPAELFYRISGQATPARELIIRN